MSFSPVILDLIRDASFVRHVEWHDTIASTNDRGNDVAQCVELETPLLILAGRQTAGRGRGANRWWSAEGALTLTLVFDPCQDMSACGLPPLPFEVWPRIALVAGVALCDVIEALLPSVTCRLKWPNDVLLDGKKVSGILVEIPPASPPAPRRLVLGMGINVNNSLTSAPVEVQSVAASLCDVAGDSFDGAQILIDWLNAFAGRLGELASADGKLVERWQSLCTLNGKSIELQSGSRTVTGVCRGIDFDGALLVDTPTGPERLYAGVLVRAT